MKIMSKTLIILIQQYQSYENIWIIRRFFICSTQPQPGPVMGGSMTCACYWADPATRSSGEVLGEPLRHRGRRNSWWLPWLGVLPDLMGELFSWDWRWISTDLPWLLLLYTCFGKTSPWWSRAPCGCQKTCNCHTVATDMSHACYAPVTWMPVYSISSVTCMRVFIVH